MALLHKKKYVVIFSHIALWVTAIAAGLVLRVDSVMTGICLPGLAFASLMTIKKLFE